jgi:hypothetical protein
VKREFISRSGTKPVNSHSGDLSIDIPSRSAEVGHLAFGDSAEMDYYAGRQVSMRCVDPKVDWSDVGGKAGTNNKSSRRSASSLKLITMPPLMCRYLSLRGSLEGSL